MLRLFAFVSLLIAMPALAAPSDRIAVSVTGKGPDVILIPGLASSAHVWDRTVEHLKATHRLHVVQVAGFAGAPAGDNATGPVLAPTLEALHAYIVANKLRGAAVIGHSLGGLMAMALAVQHPGDAGRIMIVDSLPFLGAMAGPQATVAAVQPMAEGLRAQLLAASQEQFAAMEPQQMARLIGSKTAEADAAYAAAAASDHRVVAQAMYDGFTTDLRPDLGKIAVPVTVLYPNSAAAGGAPSRADTLYGTAFAPVKQTKLLGMENSRHFIMIDQPEAFLQAVDGFLK